MVEILNRIMEKFLENLKDADTVDRLNSVRINFLGKKSEFNALTREVSKLTLEEKRTIGQLINEKKDFINSSIEEKLSIIKEEIKKQKIKNQTIDISLPGKKIGLGTIHPITKTILELKEIVSELGFDIVDGPEVELVKYNFDALNIPSNHPSREKTDTFYITQDILLRTQTSPMQIRYMLDNKPPFKMVSLGKVYRPDYDVSHTPMFHQIEGLMVGRYKLC